MSQNERLYRIDQLISDRGTISFVDLQEALEISRATLKRDLRYLRERLNAPIVFDREAGGYRFDQAIPRVGPRYRLPGLWFSADEIHALMTTHQLLDSLDEGGLIGPHIKPLMARLSGLLDAGETPAREVMRRVKLLAAQKRRVAPKCFELVGSALVKRRRLSIDYFTRSRNQRGVREVSPLRLVYWRHNWYLDAWCHTSEALRVFSLDAIERAELLEKAARNVALAEVDAQLGSGYGIYRGGRTQWATLRFTPEAARWVRAEVWHEEQQGRDLADGGWELKVPFTQSPELAMDILRHGENVEVIAPAALRRAVGERLAAAAARYADR
ncbi:MAG: WYL domain-containing protein [Burkholderiaceae bacterium]